MITIYTSSGNQSCHKSIEWFLKNNIDYKEKNIIKESITKKELFEILKYCENGVDDLLSTTGKKAELENLTLNEVVGLLIKFPKFLKTPIIANEKVVNCGFSEYEIRAFIPKNQRTIYQ